MTRVIRKRNKLGQFAKASPWEKYFNKKLFLKTTSIALISLMWVGLLNIKDTRSYYNDEENSSGNTFIAGQVDFTLTNSDFTPTTSALNLSVGDTVSKNITINPGTSNPFKYEVVGNNFTGDADFCNALNAKLKLGSTEMYNGLLSNLATSATETIDTWNLALTLPTSVQNKICNFDTEYRGSQTRHDYPLMQGYSDIETVSHKIVSSGFRINKIYYDVDSKHGSEGTNEWVEIYNQTDTALDLSGWKICDNTYCDTIPASTPLVPSHGFAIITNSATTWDYWDIPSDVVKIALGSDIGNGLGNDNDMLILKRPDNVIIDQMNYGSSPSAGWANYNSDVWHPGSVDVPEGHLLGRKPNGYDTNQASDFVDFSLPVVLLVNPDQSGTLTWYWTYHYPIDWLATNPNGPDSDIKINLSYILNYADPMNPVLLPSDTVIPIATGLSNSGSYDFTVPSGFIGYIWIKIVAVGPENVMLNSAMISGKIYDPFPEDMWNNHRDMILNGLRRAGLIADDYIPSSLAEVESIVAQASGQAQTTQAETPTTVLPSGAAPVTPTDSVVPSPDPVIAPADPAVIAPTDPVTSLPDPDQTLVPDPVPTPTPDPVIAPADPVVSAPTPDSTLVPDPIIIPADPVVSEPESTPAPDPTPTPEPAPEPTPTPTPDVTTP